MNKKKKNARLRYYNIEGAAGKMTGRRTVFYCDRCPSVRSGRTVGRPRVGANGFRSPRRYAAKTVLSAAAAVSADFPYGFRTRTFYESIVIIARPLR